MTSLSDKVEAVKTAVASTSSCTSATTVLLKELLITDSHDTSAEAATTATGRASKAGTRTTKPAPTTTAKHGAELPDDEKKALAVHVINGALKGLSEASKPSSVASVAAATTRTPSEKKTLRRSNSTPMTPLQPRTLNRVSTSPDISKTAKKQAQAATSAACLPLVECLRVAFMFLRALQNSGKKALLEGQLEQAMSKFINTAISLGLHEYAQKELASLKKRIDATGKARSGTTAAKTTETDNTAKKGLADLLCFEAENLSGSQLELAIKTQLQTLRVVAASKRPAVIEACVPFVRSSCPSSPLNLLLKMSADSPKALDKSAQQLQQFSQVLLALPPSISSSEDTVSLETRLSPKPTSCFELHAAGFEYRLHWWKLAGHQGDIDEEVLSKFSRCLAAYVRRASNPTADAYQSCQDAFKRMSTLIEELNLQPAISSKSPTASIQLSLGALAQAARQYTDASSWISRVKETLRPEKDSVAKCCSVAAQLLAITVKQKPMPTDRISKLFEELMEGMQGPLRGDISELDEMMVNLCAARRAAVNLIVAQQQEDGISDAVLSGDIVALCKDIVLQFPRFSIRWLGKPPSRDAEAKYTVRFDQRRQHLATHTSSILDSALVVLKSQLDRKEASWDDVDASLQSCSSLIDAVGEFNLPLVKGSGANSYHSKISQLYFIYSNTMRQKGDYKLEWRALRRSIDVVKDRSLKEEEKTRLAKKLERFSAICIMGNRHEDARDALKTICTNIVEDGVLATLAASLNDKSPATAWAANEKTETLSRALSSMIKLDQAWSDWTFFLPDLERAAVLEHIIQLIIGETSKSALAPQMTGSVTDALLRIYTVDRYPVRRLRTMLQLLAMKVGNDEQFENYRQQAEAALQASRGNVSVEDKALTRYLPHLEAYLTSTIAMANSTTGKSMDDLKASLSAWRGILDKSKNMSLCEHIDNPDHLLKHLDSVGHFATLRGEEVLRLTAFELCADLSLQMPEDSKESALLSHSNLADTYVSLGFDSKAEEALARATKLDLSNETSGSALASLHMSSAEHQLSRHQCDKAESILIQAKSGFEKRPESSSWTLLEKQILSRANIAYSSIALAKGDAHLALNYAKNGARLLYSRWLKLETESKEQDVSKRDDSMLSKSTTSTTTRSANGPEFWNMAYILFRSMTCLSTVYVHFGMFQETLYYAEKALAVAESMQSAAYRGQAQSLVASVHVRANDPKSGLSYLTQVRDFILSPTRPSRLVLHLACELSASYNRMNDSESEAQMIELAERTLKALKSASSDTEDLTKGVKALSLAEKPATAAPTRRTRATRATATPAVATTTTRARARAPTATTTATRRTTTTATTTTTTTTTTARTKPAATKAAAEPTPKDRFPTLRALMLMRKAFAFIGTGEWTTATGLLEEAKQLSAGSEEALEMQVNAAACLIGESLDQMISDSVFSVVQDSTISFPSTSDVSGAPKTAATKAQAPPPPVRRARGKVAAAAASTASPPTEAPGFVETLQRALSHLTEAHSRAVIAGSGYLIHRIAALLQSTSLFLSAATTGDAKSLPHDGFATFSMELARNIVWQRERKAAVMERDASGMDEFIWPSAVAQATGAESMAGQEMSDFQQKYIDIIPPSWSTVSISLSDNRQDLYITKLVSGQTPFVLRLPLARASSRDGETDAFDFEHGHGEMLEIIRETNETCHSDRDWSAKGAKTAWWKERETLDTRMKELLQMIEQVWLSGFRGIFAQHQRRAGLFSKFQAAFYAILDKHLPSRRQVRGKKTVKGPKVTLDERILDLFVALGDPQEQSDFDESLNDLLYFVVDILQFHGERNAYDEIDFDSMTIDSMDALHAYHTAALASPEPQDDLHTILVLDKSLHVFPWESLPCMQGQAVSRVPSLECLRRLILEQQPAAAAATSAAPQGHHISRGKSSYILNAGQDLPGTQKHFEGPLTTKLSPSSPQVGIVARQPSEEEFETALRDSDALIYIGHGSGSQYIRTKTIRRLEKCRAAALLMGCSSGSLTDAGDFEVHGPVWNYMMAGCPAVVGTLWDVTDKDIDRYSGRLFEEWGMFAKGTFATDKWSSGSSEQGGDEVGKAKSLVEAVARARDATRFRYITSAAVCVYGIPVYVQ